MLETVKNPGKFSKLVWFTLVALFATISNYSSAQTGEELFKNNCAACHRLTADKLVGPGLLGVGERRSQEWLLSWTKNSAALIESGDSSAVAIFTEFNNSPMPPYEQLGDSAILSIFDYIATASETPAEPVVAEAPAAEAPAAPAAEEPVTTDYTGKMVYWFAIVVVLLVAWMLWGTYRNANRAMDENGFVGYKNYNKNYLTTFAIVLLCTILVIYLLKEALAEKTPGFSYLMFGAFPYVALIIFLIGSIFRYKNLGFKVSSLSTQFLEGRQLFFGSQPFHWGMLIIFFGHLTAFLVPRAIIVWNGHPLRLLILEVSSLAFALSALIGLILLIKRRYSHNKLMVLSNNMDTLVYVILLVQIVSGIAIALFSRWGSTWFATSLTPYLRSIFTFDPQIGVADAMPWWAQIHIVSAFFIIAIIPFTRFMHFLVYPIAYTWRRYQVVYWNWNRKAIRKSTAHTYGKLPRNH